MDSSEAMLYLAVLVSVFASVRCSYDECSLNNSVTVLRMECTGPGVMDISVALQNHTGDLTEILISHSNVTVIGSRHLSRVTGLQSLAVVDSLVETVEVGAFDHLADSLRNISLAGNHLKTLPSGIFSKLERLQYLHLDNNLFRTLDSVLVGLTSLRVLSVRSNVLESLSSNELSDLNHVEIIDVSSNKLQSVNISHLPHLRKLNVENNMIVSVDYSFKALPMLEDLRLKNNLISNLTTDTFKDMTRLTYLDAGKNQLTILEGKLFYSNIHLRFLNLSENPLETMDNVLGTETPLHELDLSKCRFMKIPKSLPRSLRALHFSHNNIAKVDKVDLNFSSQLTSVVLAENHIETVEPGTFQWLTSLKNLVLSGNRLQSVPGPFPASISYLHLDYNHIVSISSESFMDGTVLETLSLRKNNLSSIDSNAFSNIRRLRTLQLDNNPIRLLNSKAFVSAPNLTVLSLNQLNLEGIYPDCFQGLTELRHLSMSFVKVRASQIYGAFLQDPQYIETLTLKNSPEIVRHFLSSHGLVFPYLHKINLMENKFEDFEASIFSIAPILSTLLLHGSSFRCTDSLLWISHYYMYDKNLFPDLSSVVCYAPKHLLGHRIIDLTHSDFPTSTISPTSWFSTDMTDAYPPYDEFYDFFGDHTSRSPTEVDVPVNESIGIPWDYYETTEPDVQNSTFETDSERGTLDVTSTDFYPVPDDSWYNDEGYQTTPKRTTATGSRSLRDAGIAIGTSLVVIVIILVVSFFIYKCYQIRQLRFLSSAQVASEDNAYAVITPHIVKPEQKVHRKLSRTERGSTASHASGDITNQIDPSMKVYTLDTDA